MPGATSETCQLLKRGLTPFRRTAILLSPLTIVPVMILLFGIMKPDDIIDGAFAGLFGNIIALPASYIALFVFGLPYVFLLHRLDLLNTRNVVLGAIALGATGGLLIGLLAIGYSTNLIGWSMLGSFMALFIAYVYCKMNSIPWQQRETDTLNKEDT